MAYRLLRELNRRSGQKGRHVPRPGFKCKVRSKRNNGASESEVALAKFTMQALFDEGDFGVCVLCAYRPLDKSGIKAKKVENLNAT